MTEVVNPRIMNVFISAIALLLSIGACNRGHDFVKLSTALEPSFPVSAINGKKTTSDCCFEIFFNDNQPGEVEIANFSQVLNGQSYTLLAAYGKILSPSQSGYVIGTAIEGPTHGKIIFYDNNHQKVSVIASQKVVKIKLLDLLNDGLEEIVTWEDHRYGTNTTRRVLNIYKLYSDKSVQKLFDHDLVDASGGPMGTQKDIYYQIDFESLRKERKIIVTDQDTGEKVIFTWNGTQYRVEVSPANAAGCKKSCS